MSTKLRKKMKPLTEIEFWEIKHAIDDEVVRLGWSKQECIEFIQKRYRCRSRLVMRDVQLRDCLKYLKGLPSLSTESEKEQERKTRRRRRRRRR